LIFPYPRTHPGWWKSLPFFVSSLFWPISHVEKNLNKILKKGHMGVVKLAKFFFKIEKKIIWLLLESVKIIINK
jgi:hypothetical protein